MLCRSTALWAAVLLLASTAGADEHGCCSTCGCHSGLKPVCRLVCEMKEVTEWVYDCKCEDFCVAGKSKKCDVCPPDCTSPHGQSCPTCWQPTCGKVYNRTLLIKYPVKKQVPVYRCEVVYVCQKCCDHCTAGVSIEQLPPLPSAGPHPAPPGAASTMPPGTPPFPPGGELRLEHPPAPQPPLPPPPGQTQRPGLPLRQAP